MLTLSLVIESLTGLHPDGFNREIRGASIDSRIVRPGSMFVALPGERVNGHDFVQEAFDRGASVVIVDQEVSVKCVQLDLSEGEQFSAPDDIGGESVCLRVKDSLQAMQKIAGFYRDQLDLKVVGITGSVGKSTTKELVAEVLSQRYNTLKSPGNLNNEIGLPLTILNLTNQHERAVLEMGFYVPGEIEFLCNIADPQIGVVTNIGTVHAERAGTIEDIARGKAELVEALPPKPEGIAILNHDDLRVRQMSELTEARVFYYGTDSDADLWADNIESLGLDGIRFRLHYSSESLHLRVPLIGRHSVHTALRAAAVGLNDGLTWQEIVDGMQTGRAQLRLVVVRANSGALILDDTYNASPQSTMAALNLLEDMDGRKVAVLGDMLELGQYERQGHQMVGSRVAEVASELVTVGERAKLIAYAASQAGMSPNQIKEFDTSEQAVDFLAQHLTPQDVVLVKGSRGMQMELIVNGLESDK